MHELDYRMRMDFVLQVSEVTSIIKSHLESCFTQVSVEGEVSGITYHSSGHVYFSIKDDRSLLSCTFFKNNFARSRTRLKNGDKIIAKGMIKVYEPRGTYSLNVLECAYSGIGSLKAQYERLKRDLEIKGYFSKNKPLPKYPKRIIFLTSKTGAALQDMIKVASNRYCLCEFILIDTLVQGSEAKNSIAKNLYYADRLKADIIVLARGGGSIEDLWAFNEMEVLESIFLAKTLVVSAIGHEIDIMLSDYVADVRAPTPSAAMEMILCDKESLYDELIAKATYIESNILHIIHKKREILSTKTAKMTIFNPSHRISLLKGQVIDKGNRLYYAMKGIIDNRRLIVNKYRINLVLSDPCKKIESHKKILLNNSIALQAMQAKILTNKRIALQNLEKLLSLKIKAIIMRYRSILQGVDNIDRHMYSYLHYKRECLLHISRILENLNPDNKLQYGLVEILRDDKQVKISDLKQGDRVELIDKSGSAMAIID